MLYATFAPLSALLRKAKEETEPKRQRGLKMLPMGYATKRFLERASLQYALCTTHVRYLY